MKRLILAAVFSVATTAAFANPCTSISGGSTANCSTNTQSNNQSVTNKNYFDPSVKAYGGNASQSQSQSQSSYNSNTNEANNAGNSQAVSFSDVRQAPPVSSYVAASGPCIGTSGSAGASVIGVGVSIGFASVESDCRKDEHIRIGLASGDPIVRAAAIQDWLTMNDDLFGKKKGGGTQTSALAPAPATEQTASLPEPALPKGQTRN